MAPAPPLIGGSACGFPTLASTNIWKGKEKSGKAMTGLDAIMFLSLNQASIASCGRSPEIFFDLHGCSELVTADSGPAISAYLSMTSLKNWKRPRCDWISLTVVGSMQLTIK
mgnify:CR=1 FL=1